MTVLIDDTFSTATLAVPVRERWLDVAAGVRVVDGLSAEQLSDDDIAVVPAAVATGLVKTHVIDRSVAVMHHGVGYTTMWTAVRPDELEFETVYLMGVGTAGETLLRAVLRPYYGITPAEMTRVAVPPDDARVIVREGARRSGDDGDGFEDDLTRSWFVMTGFPFVSHVTVVGVRALARDADEQLGLLQQIVAAGRDRRGDVAALVAERTGLDQDGLAGINRRMRYHLKPEDGEAVRRLVEMGTWETAFGRSLPAYRDQIRADDDDA